MEQNASALELTEADLEAVVGAHSHCHCDHKSSTSTGTGDGGWQE